MDQKRHLFPDLLWPRERSQGSSLLWEQLRFAPRLLPTPEHAQKMGWCCQSSSLFPNALPLATSAWKGDPACLRLGHQAGFETLAAVCLLQHSMPFYLKSQSNNGCASPLCCFCSRFLKMNQVLKPIYQLSVTRFFHLFGTVFSI